ncbi:MAG: glycosyltransferase family 9 protein [Nitrospirae bacterium]|nr:MAG: glycosyltransferase family 9 protein [Nitrospirota bacterium]
MVIIHPGGLGDVLLAVPAIVRLRTRFLNHQLVLCAEDQIARLLLSCRIIDAWTSVQGQICADLFAGDHSAAGQVQAWLEYCDLAIAWTQDLDGKLNETLKSAGVREVIVRSPFSTAIRATHQRDRFLEAIDEAPSEDEGDVLLTVTEPLLHLGRTCLEAAGLAIGQSLVVIHPGSGSAHKCVAPETLATVVIALQISGATPVVLEGPADREPVERLLQSCVNPPIVLKGLDLLTVAGVIAQARLFVGQDSGVTHMAGLMGVRTVALFGPTDPARWAPRGAHLSVVQGAPCLCQSWDDVSRCEKKPCLEMPQDHLVAFCLAHLKEAAIRQRIPSGCLVTDYPVC